MLARCSGAQPGRHMLGLQELFFEQNQGAATRRVRQAEAANVLVIFFSFVARCWACWDGSGLESGEVHGHLWGGLGCNKVTELSARMLAHILTRVSTYLHNSVHISARSLRVYES